MEVGLFAFVLVGFLAQLIDGALGMAYGVVSNACLLACGLPPAVASAAVHSAKMGASAASGASHLAFRNVDRALVWRLALPGMVGAMLGSLLLGRLQFAWLTPLVALYLLLIGVRLVHRALARPARPARPGALEPLGLAGGFCDAVGGGGWGPIVSSSLLARDLEPRLAIGSSNLAEFAVATASAAVFWGTIGLQAWRPTLGLLIGGVLAAPLGALLVRRAPRRGLILAVGLLLIALSLRTLGSGL